MAEVELTATVAICTRNRADVFATVCESVLEQDPGSPWELVVVDNSSTDRTPTITRELREAHPDRVRVVVERELGLSVARNAAIHASRSPIVIFLDDDAYPAEGWLGEVVEAFRRPEVLAVGGPVHPLFEGELPEWLDQRFLPYLTAWDLGDEPVELRYNEYPRGANMAFRREVFERFGLFSPHLGRRGSSLRSCEETELCLRIERGGGRILYVPGAPVDHRVDAGRVDRGWMEARFGAQGRSEAIIDWLHGGLRGLRIGLAKASTRIRETPRDDSLLLRFHRAARRAYLLQACLCPATIRRYRPASRIPAWRPPA